MIAVSAYLIAALKGTECYGIKLVYRVQLCADGRAIRVLFLFVFFTIQMLLGEKSLQDRGRTFASCILVHANVRLVCPCLTELVWLGFIPGQADNASLSALHTRLVMSESTPFKSFWGRNGRTAH